MGDERPPTWMFIGVYGWTLANFVFCGSVLASFLFESRPAAFVAIVAFGLVLTIHLLVAAIEYRRTMRRPWPKVAPLLDDDED